MIIKVPSDLYRLTRQERLELYHKLIGPYRSTVIQKIEVPSFWEKIKHLAPIEFERTLKPRKAPHNIKYQTITIRMSTTEYEEIRRLGRMAVENGLLERSSASTDAMWILRRGLLLVSGKIG